MANTYNHVCVPSFQSLAPVEPGHFISGTGAVCGAGERAVGVSVSAAENAGESFGVCTVGMVIVIAGATVTPGQEVEADLNGKAIPLATGKANGIAIGAATAGKELVIMVR